MSHSNPLISDRLTGPALRRVWLAFGLLMIHQGWVEGADPTLRSSPIESHSWSCFQPGASKQVRIVTETLGKKGEVLTRTIAETRTTLVSHNGANSELRVEVKLDVGGQIVSAPTRVLRQGPFGESDNQEVLVSAEEPAEVVVDGAKVKVDVHRISISDPRRATDSVLHMSPGPNPTCVRRETFVRDNRGKVVSHTISQPKGSTSVEIMGRTEMVSTYETIRESEDGRVVTTEYISHDVPGGVVAHESTELDKDGVPVRRSKLEMVEFAGSKRSQPVAVTKPTRRMRREMRRERQ